MNQIDSAISHLRNLVKKESKNTNLFCIWPTTVRIQFYLSDPFSNQISYQVIFVKKMDHLRKKCQEQDQLKVRAFNDEVRDRMFDSGRDLLPYMEHLTKFATESKFNVKHDEKRQPFQFYKSSSSFLNNEEDSNRKLKGNNIDDLHKLLI